MWIGRGRVKVGVPKEIKTLEFRVGMTPAGVRELVHDGHEVVVETNAGLGIGMFDVDYERAGATVVGSAEEVFATANMIVLTSCYWRPCSATAATPGSRVSASLCSRSKSAMSATTTRNR